MKSVLDQCELFWQVDVGKAEHFGLVLVDLKTAGSALINVLYESTALPYVCIRILAQCENLSYIYSDAPKYARRNFQDLTFKNKRGKDKMTHILTTFCCLVLILWQYLLINQSI